MDFQHFAPQIDKLRERTPKEIASIAFRNSVRDNFTISTWLAIGAVLQGLLVFFVRPTFAVAPAAIVLFYRISHTMLVHFGILRNPQMDDVLMGKYTVQMPDKDGNPPSESAEHGMAVIMLGMRTNHALGLFGPGARELGDSITEMLASLSKDKKNNGFLGASYYQSTNERLTTNGFMTCCYFRSVEDIHRFAHSPIHREGWNWWSSITDSHPHLSIMHELYSAPKKNWENIFINYHLTGIGKIQTPVIINGREYKPVVNALRGPLSTQKGRIGQPGLSANEKPSLIDAED
ncbi:hypothetical protein V8C37DRAFT_373076 [Trichoderma ceciliae]